MARKKRHAEHVNHERWLVSYADFITLLFAFFVVMFASSQTDKNKAQQISDSVKAALEKGATAPVVREVMGGTVGDVGKGNAMMKGPGGSVKSAPSAIKIPDEAIAELMPSMKYLTKALEAEIKLGKIDIHLEPRGLVISLRQEAFFPSGGDDLDPKTYAAVDKIGAMIRDLPNPIRLEGHTDSVPIHSDRYRSNWELSAARSISMLEAFTNRQSVPRERLAISGFADTMPVDTNDTVEGRAHNRRVDIVIINIPVALKGGPAAGGAGKTNSGEQMKAVGKKT
jgi:chemotaxis protein MotB